MEAAKVATRLSEEKFPEVRALQRGISRVVTSKGRKYICVVQSEVRFDLHAQRVTSDCRRIWNRLY